VLRRQLRLREDLAVHRALAAMVEDNAPLVTHVVLDGLEVWSER
jgi:hypothetical protein